MYNSVFPSNKNDMESWLKKRKEGQTDVALRINAFEGSQEKTLESLWTLQDPIIYLSGSVHERSLKTMLKLTHFTPYKEDHWDCDAGEDWDGI